MMRNRRLGFIRVAIAIAEGITIGVGVRRPVVPVIGACLILTAMRLRLEAALP